nr:MAG TPA: hypothetical protein [Caudoviricetes sp.]
MYIVRSEITVAFEPIEQVFKFLYLPISLLVGKSAISAAVSQVNSE